MASRLRLSLVLLGAFAVTPPTSADYFFSDLVDAAKRGDAHAVHKLLEEDPSCVDATDSEGYTALHWAGIRGHWWVFAELLAAGAPVNAAGADGGTTLHWTCHHDRADMVGQLLDAGANLGAFNRWGRAPLHVAARRGCLEVATLLVARGADENATTREGWTPLHVAYRSGHDDMVELLLAQGADPDRADEDGLRPADSAFERPAEMAVEPRAFDEYVGLYELGPGFTVKVWQEGNRLRIREFAPDDLYPIERDAFFCRQEPWRVVFHRDDAGGVASVEIRFLRRTVTGVRTDTPRFVGSQACRECHIDAEHGNQYVSWLRSRHAHAFWRLGADWALFLARLRPHYKDLESPIEDTRCHLCHVTGAQNPDNLFADTYRPEEGVSCEACHGPGSRYIDPEIMADRERFLDHGGIVPDQTTCRRCHRASDNFDFAELWPKIAHPRPDADPPAQHE